LVRSTSDEAKEQSDEAEEAQGWGTGSTKIYLAVRPEHLIEKLSSAANFLFRL